MQVSFATNVGLFFWTHVGFFCHIHKFLFTRFTVCRSQFQQRPSLAWCDHPFFCSSHFPTPASTPLRFSRDKRDLHTRQKRPTNMTKETKKYDQRYICTYSFAPHTFQLSHPHSWGSPVTKETYIHDKRDQQTLQKRPTYTTKETNKYDKIYTCTFSLRLTLSESCIHTLEILQWQNRPTYTTKETNKHDKRDQHIRQKRPTNMTKDIPTHTLLRLTLSESCIHILEVY